MNHDNLRDLSRLLERARSVVALQEVHAGNHDPRVIALRHDVDDNPHSFETATKIAQWEAARGYRSTFFILHTASYWTDAPFFRAELEQIALAGHEIGIHANAIAAALVSGGDPHEILWHALDQLRDWGFPVRGMAPHGDEVCRVAHFVNDEQFIECRRSDQGPPDRELRYRGNVLRLEPMNLSSFGLAYDAYRLPRGSYLSDSGGSWNVELLDALAEHGQLHILQHPDWWFAAFPSQEVAA